MFLFMGINCSPWHRWPWSHCPSPVGGGVSYSFWWSQSLFYCFLPFSISWSSSLCFGLFSTNTSSARELMSLCLPKEVHLYFLRHEIKSQNLGLGKTLPWKVLVAVILLCFLQDRQYFKTNILCTLGRHPLVPLCFILPVSSCLLTRVSLYTHVSANFCDDITVCIHHSWKMNWGFVGMFWALWFVLLGTLAAQHFCFRSSHEEISSLSKQILFQTLGQRNCGSNYLALGLVWVLMPWRRNRIYPCSACEPWKRAQHLSRAILIRKSQPVATSFALALFTCLFGGVKSHPNRKSLSGFTIFAGVGSRLLLFQ